MIEKNRKHPVGTGQYATVADFKRIFTEDVNRLYLLSLLLTGDPENAEKCFVEGIGESSVELARHAEQLGYKRYWDAEHHAIQGMACSATPMLTGHIAAATKTIRVGSGGVTLPNHAPLVVAEQFGALNRHLISNEDLEPTLNSEVTVGAALIFMPARSKIPFLRFGTRAGIAMTLLNAKRS